MSRPSTSDAARLGIAQPLQQRQRRRLARAGRADQRHRLAGRHLEIEIEHALRAGAVAEADVLELDVALHVARAAPRRLRSVIASLVSSSWKNERSVGACMKMRVTKPDSRSSLPISSCEKPTKLTISPTRGLALRRDSIAPIANTATIVTVEAERVRIVSRPHQVSTGYCAASNSAISPRSALISADSRV